MTAKGKNCKCEWSPSAGVGCRCTRVPVARRLRRRPCPVPLALCRFLISTRGGAATKPLAACAVVSYIFFTLRSVTPLGWDSDTVFLLTLPRTEAEDWYATFATTAHPFGLLAQHLYLDLAEGIGISEIVAWKFALGGCLLIQGLLIFKVYGMAASCCFFFGLTAFPSLWRNVLSLEEEIIGMTLFCLTLLFLSKVALEMDFQRGRRGSPGRSRQPQAKSALHLAITVATIASLWHFQYWYIISVAITCLAFQARYFRSTLWKVYGIWGFGTAIYLPICHVVGIVRSTPYHEEWPSLPNHLSAGEPLSEWARWVLRCLFWHGEPYHEDSPLIFLIPILVAICFVGSFFKSHRFGSSLKSLGAVFLLATLSLPVLYEPTSSERWLPFWTVIVFCGMMSFASHEALELTPNRLFRGSSTGPILTRSGATRFEIGGASLRRMLLSAMMITVFVLSTFTWHEHFSTSQLRNWSDFLRAQRCGEVSEGCF